MENKFIIQQNKITTEIIVTIPTWIKSPCSRYRSRPDNRHPNQQKIYLINFHPDLKLKVIVKLLHRCCRRHALVIRRSINLRIA